MAMVDESAALVGEEVGLKKKGRKKLECRKKKKKNELWNSDRFLKRVVIITLTL